MFAISIVQTRKDDISSMIDIGNYILSCTAAALNCNTVKFT